MKTAALAPRPYLVGVFDLVGLSNIFQPGETAADAEAMKETLGVLRWACSTLTTVFAEFPVEKNRLAPYDRDLRTIETLLGETEVKLQAFADTLIPFAEMPESQHHLRALSAMLRMFNAAGQLMLLTLAGGRALRGGIDMGNAVERAPSEIYGTALNAALALEMRRADYPRIAIGPALRAYLKRIGELDGSTVFVESAKTLAARCSRLIVDDLDGQAILHYLSPEFRPAAREASILSQAQSFIAEQKQFWQSSGQPHLAARYQRLQQYWQRHT